MKSKTLMTISKKESTIAEENQSDVPRFGRRGLRPPSWNERIFLFMTSKSSYMGAAMGLPGVVVH